MNLSEIRVNIVADDAIVYKYVRTNQCQVVSFQCAKINYRDFLFLLSK